MAVELGGVILEDGPESVADWSTVPGSHLHYLYFIGDVRFRIGDADFSTDSWGWVPVFDFAAALRSIVAGLEPGQEERFEFTENADIIRFRRTGDEVTVSAAYVDVVATVGYEELRAATGAFLDDVGQELLSRHPSLGRNKHFTDLVFRAD